MIVEGRQRSVCVHERCGAGICDHRLRVSGRAGNLFVKRLITEDHGLVVQCNISINLEKYVIYGPIAVRTFDGSGGQFTAVFGSVYLSELDRWEHTPCCRVEVRGENWKVQNPLCDKKLHESGLGFRNVSVAECRIYSTVSRFFLAVLMCDIL